MKWKKNALNRFLQESMTAKRKEITNRSGEFFMWNIIIAGNLFRALAEMNRILKICLLVP